MTLLGQRRSRRPLDVRFSFSILNCYLRYCLIVFVLSISAGTSDFRKNDFFTLLSRYLYRIVLLSAANIYQQILIIKLDILLLIATQYNTDATRPAHVIALERHRDRYFRSLICSRQVGSPRLQGNNIND